MGGSKSKPEVSKPKGTFRPLSTENDVQLVLNGRRITSFQTRSGISLAFSEDLTSSEALQQAESNTRGRRQFLAYLENSQVACFSLQDRCNAVTVECKLLSIGEHVRVGEGFDVQVLSATRQIIKYQDSGSYAAGTPVFSGANVVGIHLRAGRALSMLWVCHEAEESFHEELAPLLREVIRLDLAQDQAHKSRFYRISGRRLLSYYPDTKEPLQHSSKISEHAQLCIVSNGLFIAGGLQRGKAVAETYIFDTGLGILGLRQPMTTPRWEHCLGSLRNQVYCIGGLNEVPLSHCEICSLRNCVSVPVPELPSARVGAGAVVFNEKLYVIGGSLDGSQAVIREIVRLTESGWEDVPHSLPQFTTHVLSGVPLSGEEIWILSNELCRWDPDTSAQKHEASQCQAPRSLHVSHSSLYIFTDQQVQEVKVRPDPWLWKASLQLESN